MRRLTTDTLDEEVGYLRLFMYGAPGVGKTWLGASGCLSDATSPWLFLSYRSQIQSLAANEDYRHSLLDGSLVVIELDGYENINLIYNWMKLRRPGYNAKMDELFTLNNEIRWPKGVTLDSITELQRTEAMRRAGVRMEEVQTDVPAPEIRDWGHLLHQFTLLGRLMYDSPAVFPYHVVFCALEMAEYDADKVTLATKDNRPTGFKPAMQGQAQDLVPAYALTLMRLVKAPRNVDYFNRGMTYEPRSASKDQSGRFPSTVNGPTIPKMVSMLQGG